MSAPASASSIPDSSVPASPATASSAPASPAPAPASPALASSAPADPPATSPIERELHRLTGHILALKRLCFQFRAATDILFEDIAAYPSYNRTVFEYHQRVRAAVIPRFSRELEHPTYNHPFPGGVFAAAGPPEEMVPYLRAVKTDFVAHCFLMMGMWERAEAAWEAGDRKARKKVEREWMELKNAVRRGRSEGGMRWAFSNDDRRDRLPI